VRTTLTLDDEIARKLRAESRRAGRSFRDVVNDTLRRGLASECGGSARKRFRVKARDMGLKPGLSLDNVAEVLEHVEGPAFR